MPFLISEFMDVLLDLTCKIISIKLFVKRLAVTIVLRDIPKKSVKKRTKNSAFQE